MSLFVNVRLFVCGIILAFAAVVYAAESDFVCSVVNASNVVCDDCHKFCSGCGITCDKDGHILSIVWPSSGIESLPQSIGDLTSLTELNLKDNKLTDLPNTTGKLQSLKSIGLASNSFSEIPSVLLNLAKLEELDISGNSIKTIPEGFKTLKLFAAQHNQIENVSVLCKIPTLTYLRLCDNKLSEVPDCFSGLKNLKLLTLGMNQLTDLPNLTALTALKELVLASNSYIEFPVSACLIPNLAILNLAANKITAIPDSCASSVVSTLNLGQNAFETFPVNLYQWANLRTLNLAKNLIPDVNLTEDEQFAVLNDIDLSSNVISCDVAEHVFLHVNTVTCSRYENVPPVSSSSGSGKHSESGSTSGMPGWEIAVIVVGCIVAVAIIVAVIVVICLNRNKSRTGYVSINHSH